MEWACPPPSLSLNLAYSPRPNYVLGSSDLNFDYPVPTQVHQRKVIFPSCEFPLVIQGLLYDPSVFSFIQLTCSQCQLSSWYCRSVGGNGRPATWKHQEEILALRGFQSREGASRWWWVGSTGVARNRLPYAWGW